MDALDALLTRASTPKLTDPAPTAQERDIIFSAALRAPDHGLLRPWQLVVVEGEARKKLGDVFARIAQTEDANISAEQVERARSLPLRAPLLVVVVARINESPKIPKQEQLLSAGAAAHAMLVAAHALGYGAIWRTGAMAYHGDVKKALGVASSDEIVSFLYIGTPEGEPKIREPLPLNDYVKNWGKPS